MAVKRQRPFYAPSVLTAMVQLPQCIMYKESGKLIGYILLMNMRKTYMK